MIGSIIQGVGMIANGITSGIQNRKARKQANKDAAIDREIDERRYRDDLKQRALENRRDNEAHGLSMDSMRQQKNARRAFGKGLTGTVIK
jgi:uncharacterized protein (DUF2336 family)